jgi:hypothetical protein
VPIEDAEEEEQNAFYEKLEEIYYKTHKYDVKSHSSGYECKRREGGSLQANNTGQQRFC